MQGLWGSFLLIQALQVNRNHFPFIALKSHGPTIPEHSYEQNPIQSVRKSVTDERLRAPNTAQSTGPSLTTHPSFTLSESQESWPIVILSL